MTSGSHTSPPVFWLVSGISLLLYTITLAPSVTLEYSGSLVTAADSLGVANPPGYPVWTLLAWFFQKLFGFVRYHGAPNPAWGVNFMSAFFGSLSCGLVAHMVSRSVRSESRGVSDPQASCAAWIAGTSAGLLFAFSPFMWAQSVIAETNTLNVFSVVLFLALLQGGVLDDGKRFLYPLAFLLGIGFLNSPTFVLMIPLFAAAWAKRGTWRQVPALLLCLALGLLPMAYLPLASAQNPPVNWGYARTLDGFIHLVTRGQYEHMTLTPVFSAPDVFLAQMATYIRLLAAQFSTPVLVLGIPALFGMRHGGLWKPALLAAFLLYGTGTTIGMNPPLDHQTLYYCRVVWIPSYALAAILIGLGLGWIF
ncbi:MAG TPA: DUF2723 domain-containing protein, partial [Kiritimatiellia bacterium]|nr:DUF2723 domain-containing protein [Kiritimatiellia bacterium]